MPDPPEPVDPTGLSDLVTALRQLHFAAGMPTTRRISAAVRVAGVESVSHETVAAMLRGAALPRWPKLEAVVRQLAQWAPADVDPDREARRFQALWLHAGDPEAAPAADGDVLAAGAYSAGVMAENARLAYLLRRHMNARDDPCRGRGVGWPCDVAEAFMSDMDTEP